MASGIAFKARLKLLYLLSSSVPSIAFQYTFWSARSSVLRQLFLDLGLQYFKILKSNYLCSPKQNGLIECVHNLKQVTHNYSNNTNIKNNVEGTKVQIKDKQCCFPSLLIYLFSIPSVYLLRSQPLYIMLISTVQIDCYNEFLRAFICL